MAGLGMSEVGMKKHRRASRARVVEIKRHRHPTAYKVQVERIEGESFRGWVDIEDYVFVGIDNLFHSIDEARKLGVDYVNGLVGMKTRVVGNMIGWEVEDTYYENRQKWDDDKHQYEEKKVF